MDFLFYHPGIECEDVAWGSSGFTNFMKCAPFWPGEQLWWFCLSLRTFAIILYLTATYSMVKKFAHIEVGTTAFYYDFY